MKVYLQTSTVVKTALASSLSWWLAVEWLGRSKPYMAALAAILSINITMAETLSRGTQRILGVIGGITVAFAVAAFWGMNAWTVGLLVLVSLGVGQVFNLGTLGAPQIAISGLMVWSMGHHRELSYGLLRVGDTLVGAAVAIAVNGLLHPADLSEPAMGLAGVLLSTLKTSVQDIETGLRTPTEVKPSRLRAHARSSDLQLASLNGAIDAAERSLRWNLWASRGRRRVRRLQKISQLLEKNHTQVRAIARVVADLAEEQKLHEEPALAEVMNQTANTFDALAVWLEGKDKNLSANAVSLTATALAQYWRSTALSMELAQTPLWSVGLTAGRLVADQEAFVTAEAQEP